MERRWKVLLVTAVAVFMSFLDVTIVNIAFPAIRGSFPDASLASLSWILNAYNIVFAALLVPAGRLADRVGRRRIFLTGTCVFIAASVACGLAPTVPVLVAARVVQAAGAALLVPSSLALLLPEFPLEQRATATSLWGATGAVAAATGPALGGLLVDAAGWRWVFFVNLFIGLPALIPARRILRESREATSGPLSDVLGILLLIGGVGLLSLGIVKEPAWGMDDLRTALSIAGAVALLVVFVIRAGRVRAPIVDLRLFRTRSFSVAVLGASLFALGFYALLLCNVLFLTEVWHYAALHAGLAVTPGPLMAALSAPLAGRLADRHGQRVVALPGGLLFALGCVMFAVHASAHPDYVADFLPWMLLTGTGVGLSFSAWGSAAVAELPPSRFATGSAIQSCARQIGAVLGISILIAVVGTPAPGEVVAAFQQAWVLMAIPTAAAGLAAIALGRVRARDPEAAPAAASTPAGAPAPALSPSSP